ncbi:type II toxin-antitoxin system Phd/YefM family antitoxin [Streptomyces scabiei]|uniref:type II toxin-antitoxin system Phd/YefM family antitoxin n=1 Tax=Streptomyces scabiei TaxID=1930 RepID=UPI0029A2E8F2|nr:type II toxin-antitoxin system Phd/YefM family antitoxin [Streptomyces scabiei]MDX3283937.1 type II toxin-antitoxin system Phd/YefM family antitoxin [Streptomyces scabiei]
MAYEIPVTQARAELAELINRVVYGGERVVVTRHGKPLVALVSAADLEQLESLQEPTDEPVISSVSRCLLYTYPTPRDGPLSCMTSSA